MFNQGFLSEWHWNITSQINVLFTSHVQVYTTLVTVVAQIHIEARVSVLNLSLSVLLSILYYPKVVVIQSKYSDIKTYLNTLPSWTGLMNNCRHSNQPIVITLKHVKLGSALSQFINLIILCTDTTHILWLYMWAKDISHHKEAWQAHVLATLWDIFITRIIYSEVWPN